MEHGHIPGLKERLNFLVESQFWPAEKLRKYQKEKLMSLLRHAYETVPFYGESFRAAGIDLSKDLTDGEFRKIPVIDKEMIKKAPEKFISRKYDLSSLSFITTGGSTGDPLKIYMDELYRAFDHANTYFYLKVLNGNGYDPKEHRSVRLHGDVITDRSTGSPRLWERRENNLVLSSYQLNGDTARQFVSLMNEFKPEYIHAYPSAITMLSRYIEDLGIKLDFKIDCVYCDSEALYESQKKLISGVFSCPVFQVYGHTEGALIGIQCRDSDCLHFIPQVGILELQDESGNEVRDEAGKGQIVATGFNNMVMPFIRYRTGDLGVLRKKKCPCGRDWPLLEKVEGRIQDYAVDKNGGLVAIGPTLFDYNIDWSGVDRFQIRQESRGKLLFKLKMLEGGAGDGSAFSRIKNSLQSSFSGVFDIDVAPVDDLGFTRIGKFRYLDQKLDLKGEFAGRGKTNG